MTRRSTANRFVSPLAAAILVLSAEAAMCSEIYHRTLEEVVDAKTRVFAARVKSESREDDEDRVRRVFEVSDVRWVVGTGGVPAPTRLVFSYRVPVMRDAKGNVVGHYSPILESSGKEGDAKPGETWLFFTRDEGSDSEAETFRLEPTSEEKIVKALAAKLAEPVKPAPAPASKTKR